MFKRIICLFKGHDWEQIPRECLKEEYDLPISGGRICIRCGLADVTRKDVPSNEVDIRKDKAKELLREYLGLNGGYTSGGAIVPGCPSPWARAGSYARPRR